MRVEISQEQKESLAGKIDLCVEFLKSTIQPHLTSKDNISVSMGPVLDLYLTRNSLYVKQTRFYNFGFDFPVSTVFYLERDKKTARKYICEAAPDLAVEFLKNWDKAKSQLMNEVNEKNEEVDKLNSFIDNFEL